MPEYYVNRVSDTWAFIVITVGVMRNFKKCTVIGKRGNALTREIKDAETIVRLGEGCVNTLSILLSPQELDSLSRRQHAR